MVHNKKEVLRIAPPVRTDSWGDGNYGAPRGDRKHRGIDYACQQGSKVLAIRGGKVTKIGYPYNPSDMDKGWLRYVQVTDVFGHHVRYFYVEPTIWLHTVLKAGEEIGTTQNLNGAYKGITNHVHLEVKLSSGEYINPNEYFNNGL